MFCVGQEPVEASSVPKKRRSFTVSQGWLEAAAQVRFARKTVSLLWVKNCCVVLEPLFLTVLSCCNKDTQTERRERAVMRAFTSEFFVCPNSGYFPPPDIFLKRILGLARCRR